MDSIFNNTEATAPVEGQASETNAKKEKIQAMKASFKETVQTSPDFVSRLHKLSDSIKVVNTLGYGNSGNIVVDKKASSDTDRVLKPTSTICGYKLENIGTETIPYTTEVYTKDETGKFVGQQVQKQWAPGEVICLTRQYTTMLCSIPEISFTLANGKIVASSRKGKNKSLKDELASYYFAFTKAEDGTTLAVNDDEVKLSIDDADGNVKPEYVETFGYLNNPKDSAGKKGKGPKWTTQDLAANFIHKMLEEQGI